MKLFSYIFIPATKQRLLNDQFHGQNNFEFSHDDLRFPGFLKQNSVTRFVEISSLWQNIQSLGQNSKGVFSILQHFVTNWVHFVCNWATFHCYK